MKSIDAVVVGGEAVADAAAVDDVVVAAAGTWPDIDWGA